jgi:hypothetical protein
MTRNILDGFSGVYSQSHFLDFIVKDTGAHFEPYRHYQIACQNHKIDIVATSAPVLTSLSREEAKTLLES